MEMSRLSGLCRAHVVFRFYRDILSNPALLMPFSLIVYSGFLFTIYSPFSPRIHRVSIIFPLYPSFVRHFYVICVIIDETVDDAFLISSDFTRRSDWADRVCPIGFTRISLSIMQTVSAQFSRNTRNAEYTEPLSKCMELLPIARTVSGEFPGYTGKKVNPGPAGPVSGRRLPAAICPQ